MSEGSGLLLANIRAHDKNTTHSASTLRRNRKFVTHLLASLTLGYLLGFFSNKSRTRAPTVTTAERQRAPYVSPIQGEDLQSPQDSRPHVVLAIADDLGYNDVGYGSLDLYACTPNLDAMRRDGLECGPRGADCRARHMLLLP